MGHKGEEEGLQLLFGEWGLGGNTDDWERRTAQKSPQVNGKNTNCEGDVEGTKEISTPTQKLIIKRIRGTRPSLHQMRSERLIKETRYEREGGLGGNEPTQPSPRNVTLHQMVRQRSSKKALIIKAAAKKTRDLGGGGPSRRVEGVQRDLIK